MNLKSMRSYELTVILKSESAKKVADLLKKLKAEVLGSEEPVKRTLAYPIQKLAEGYYAFYQIQIDPAVVLELDKALRLDEDIIRHLLIVKSQKLEVKSRRSKKT